MIGLPLLSYWPNFGLARAKEMRTWLGLGLGLGLGIGLGIGIGLGLGLGLGPRLGSGLGLDGDAHEACDELEQHEPG